MRAALLFLFAGCATLPRAPAGPSGWRLADWADTDFTKAAVRCAVAGEYGQDLADKVASIPIFVRSGVWLLRFDAQTVAVYLDADARSLQATPYRHEIFEHAVPFFRTNGQDANPDHDPAWSAVAKRLDERSSACRREAKE